MRLLFLLLAFPLALNAAITEKYGSAAGAGSHDGSTEGNAFNFIEMIADINAGGKAGNRYNYKGDIANTTTNITISGSGTTNSPVIIRGYKTTIGDGYQGRTNGNNGLIPDNIPSVSFTTGIFSINSSYIVLESLKFSSTRNGTGVALNGLDMVVRGCIISSAASGSSSTATTSSNNGLLIQNSDFSVTNGGNAGSAAVSITAAYFRIIGCRVSSSTNGIAVSSNSSGEIVFNTILNCGVGINNQNTSVGGSLAIIANTITGCSSDGIRCSANTSTVTTIINNCITDNGGWGITIGNTGNITYVSNNRTRDNTGGAIQYVDDWFSAMGWGEVTTDTGGPEQDYVNASITDYRLISTSPAVGVGLPLYYSLGALQPQPSSGTTTAVSHSFPIFQ